MSVLISFDLWLCRKQTPFRSEEKISKEKACAIVCELPFRSHAPHT